MKARPSTIPCTAQHEPYHALASAPETPRFPLCNTMPFCLPQDAPPPGIAPLPHMPSAAVNGIASMAQACGLSVGVVRRSRGGPALCTFPD